MNLKNLEKLNPPSHFNVVPRFPFDFMLLKFLDTIDRGEDPGRGEMWDYPYYSSCRRRGGVLNSPHFFFMYHFFFGVASWRSAHG